MQHILGALILATFPQDAAGPIANSTTAPDPPTTPMEVMLWPDGTPDAPANPGLEVNWGEAPDRYVRDVHVPTITVYRPAGAEGQAVPAVLVCPGGGYQLLSMDKEGHEVARWFAEQGVCGVVLKSRLPRPAGHVYGHGAPLADAARALALIAENAGEWSIDGARVGVMGFSAGGHLAASASVLLEGPQRPAFTVLIYPVISMRESLAHVGSRNQLLGPDPTEEWLARYSCEEQVDAQTPPAFLAHTSDDPVNVLNSVAYYSALQKAGVPSELHVYDRGGHGYGMRYKDLPVGQWPQALRRWMEVGGFLGSKD